MIIDGNKEKYVKCPDGQMRIDPTDTFVTTIKQEGRDRKFIEYDRKRGVLALDINRGDLEDLISKMGGVPEEGTGIAILVPHVGECYFDQIKQINTLYDSGPYQGFAGKLITKKRNIIERLKDYFTKALSA